jgi:hypothetical protein
VADLKPVVEMANRAVASDDRNGASYMQTWTALAKGMTDYRAGNYESAAHWLERSIPGMDSRGQSLGYFFLAMAESRCGRGSKAEAAFVKGTELLKGDGVLGGAFPTWYKDWMYKDAIIALHAQREAAALLGHPLPQSSTQNH